MPVILYFLATFCQIQLSSWIIAIDGDVKMCYRMNHPQFYDIFAERVAHSMHECLHIYTYPHTPTHSRLGSAAHFHCMAILYLI